MTSPIQVDDQIVDQLLSMEENARFEVKRIKGNLAGIIESVVAFANSAGGLLVIGLEDPDKAQGRQRVVGLQENLMNWDELNRNLKSRITDITMLPLKVTEIGCTLNTGQPGSIAVFRVGKSPVIHSVVNDGTWVRLNKSNRELTAQEIHELMFARGAITAESQLVDVSFDLLNTSFWQTYAQKRNLTRPIDQAMYHIGLAKKDKDDKLKPTRAAVLLFAEEPSGLLVGKAAIRIFHYRGGKIEMDPNTNLLRPPATISGPLILQIQKATDYVVQELAKGIQMGPLGFEIVQKYPLRVIREAITNAVIHRDYHLNSDIQIRIFDERIEVESPGSLAGPVTIQNISHIGTYSRNALIVDSLREFPSPPNLDAGEGVRMMFGTMRQANLYPPLYVMHTITSRDCVNVTLFNMNRPGMWEQVSDYIDKNGWIANHHVREILRTDDTLKASKLLKEWVDKGLLLVDNPQVGTKARKYTKPGVTPEQNLFALDAGKESTGLA